jgi:hypothetical protein
LFAREDRSAVIVMLERIVRVVRVCNLSAWTRRLTPAPYPIDALWALPHRNVADHRVGAHIDLRNGVALRVGNEHEAAGRTDADVARAGSYRDGGQDLVGGCIDDVHGSGAGCCDIGRGAASIDADTPGAGDSPKDLTIVLVAVSMTSKPLSNDCGHQ